MALLIASKRVLLIILLSFRNWKSSTEQNQVNRKIVPLWRFSELPNDQHISSWLVIILIINWRQLALLDDDLKPANWRPLSPRVIFHLLKTFFETLVPLKTMCARHAVISIRFLKHSKSLWRSFPQPNQIFRVYSFLSAHSWRTWKRCDVNKIFWKNPTVADCWDYSFILPWSQIRW